MQHFFLVRRLSWPMALSLALHSSLIAALLYASYHEVRPLPVSRLGQINAIMVNPAMFATVGGGATASATPSAPASVARPPAPAMPPAPAQKAPPETRSKSVAPSPVARAEAKAVHSPPQPAQRAEQAKRQALVPRAARPSTVEQAPTPTRSQTAPRTHKSRQVVAARHASSEAADSATPSSVAAATAQASPAIPSSARGDGGSGAAANRHSAGGPQAVSRREPDYPVRALALHIEGRVKVSFDVDDSGRVDNVRIVSADPAGVFEREVKRAVRRWRYQPGRPGHDVRVTVYFRIDGRSTVE
ncbi:TonB family protein [Edwardsiella hoshinae]|nr:TonB family protein [Edwardsiella hoshinae]